jgi:hypothetical protein
MIEPSPVNKDIREYIKIYTSPFHADAQLADPLAEGGPGHRPSLQVPLLRDGELMRGQRRCRAASR